MGNKNKRAKRAKLKAKQARISKAKSKRSEEDQLMNPSPELIELFKVLPEPTEENTEEIVDEISQFMVDSGLNDQINDIEATSMIFLAMYINWYSDRLVKV